MQIDTDILSSLKSEVTFQFPGILSNHRESFHAVGPKHSDLHLFRFKCGIFILNIIVSQSKENDGCKTCEHSIVPKTKQEKEIQQIMLSLRLVFSYHIKSKIISIIYNRKLVCESAFKRIKMKSQHVTIIKELVKQSFIMNSLKIILNIECKEGVSESESERSEGDVCRSPQDYIKEIQIKRKGAEEKCDNIQENAASEQHLSRWNILNLQSKKSRKDGQDDQLQQTNFTF